MDGKTLKQWNQMNQQVIMTSEQFDSERGLISCIRDEDDEMFEDDGVDVATLMTSLLATEDGDTVCTALVSITQQLQMQNKILIKILSELKN